MGTALTSSLPSIQDHFCAFFGNQVGGRIGIARSDARHDRGIHYARPLQAMHAKAVVHDRSGPTRLDSSGDGVRPSAATLKFHWQRQLLYRSPTIITIIESSPAYAGLCYRFHGAPGSVAAPLVGASPHNRSCASCSSRSLSACNSFVISASSTTGSPAIQASA